MRLIEAILTRSLWWQKSAGQGIVTRFDKQSGSNFIYIGFAPRGSATSDVAWFIVKFTYDSADDPTVIETSVSNVIWDNRTTISYA